MGQRIRAILFVLIGVVVVYVVLIMVSNGERLEHIVVAPMLGILIAFIVHRATLPLLETSASGPPSTISCSAYLMQQYGYPLIMLGIGWLILARPWIRKPPPSHEAVSRAMMGDEWPLTVENGTLTCLESQAIVFETNGQRYAVNGAAEKQGFAELSSIWASHSDESGKRDLAPFIERGMKLCQ